MPAALFRLGKLGTGSMLDLQTSWRDLIAEQSLVGRQVVSCWEESRVAGHVGGRATRE